VCEWATCTRDRQSEERGAVFQAVDAETRSWTAETRSRMNIVSRAEGCSGPRTRVCVARTRDSSVRDSWSRPSFASSTAWKLAQESVVDDSGPLDDVASSTLSAANGMASRVRPSWWRAKATPYACLYRMLGKTHRSILARRPCSISSAAAGFVRLSSHARPISTRRTRGSSRARPCVASPAS